MAHGKCKSRDAYCCLHSEQQKPARIKLNGILVVHKYNPSIDVEFMASSVIIASRHFLLLDIAWEWVVLMESGVICNIFQRSAMLCPFWWETTL